MSVVYLLFGLAASIAAVVVAGPAVWRLLCMPGKFADQLSKLDKLDGIEEAANEARDEWHGATDALNRLSDNYEARLAALESWRRRVERSR